MKKILLFIYLLLSGSPFLLAQNANYDKILPSDFDTDTQSRNIIPTNDGGFAILGSRATNQNGIYAHNFISFSKSGKILTSKTHVVKRFSYYISKRVFKQLKDDNFLMTFQSSTDFSESLVKTDINFKPIWSLSIEIVDFRHDIKKILELENGNILIVGSALRSKNKPTPYPYYYFYAEISPNGDVIRKQLYKLNCINYSSSFSFVYDAQISPSGKLYLAIQGGEGYKSNTIVSLDISTGKILFQRKMLYDVGWSSGIISIFYDDKSTQSSDQILGFISENPQNDNRINIFALDGENGAVKFTKSYSSFAGFGNIVSVEKSNGNLVVISTLKGDIYTVTFDKQGNIVTANKELNHSTNYIQSTIQLKDGRIISKAEDIECNGQLQLVIKFRGENNESPCTVPFTPQVMVSELTNSPESTIEASNITINIINLVVI